MAHELTLLLLLAGCSQVEIPEAPICTVPRIAGTGLYEGRGIVHLMVGGTYTFTNGIVNRKQGPQTFPTGGYATVYRSTRLEWTRPDGVHEVVPTEFLYPPGGIAPPTY